MKKLAIAGASLALAAMPVVGVFAATDGSFIDNINVNVAGGCTMGQNNSGSTTAVDRTFEASIVNGTSEVLSGTEGGAAAPSLIVQCNTTSASSFNITAKATNGGALKSGSETIPSGNVFSGDNSAFAYSLDGSNWLPVPTETAGKVVKSGSASSSTPATFNPSYKVYVSLGQASGTYTGSVTYTLAMGS